MNDKSSNRWQLPDGVNELLPDQAWRVELLRRQITDNSALWGYELVMPPLIEYLDSLLTGTGETLDLQTFKFIDQHNGRSLGVRADITPQVARIDAHALRSEHPNRLFYIGSVLRARSDGPDSSRAPLQFGAELFGHRGVESDAEIILLMVDHVVKAGIDVSALLLDLGHVGIYRAMTSAAKAAGALNDEMEADLFDAMLRGSWPEINAVTHSIGDASHQSEPSLATQLEALMQLSGPASEVLSRARAVLQADAQGAVSEALSNMQDVIAHVACAFPDLNIHVDLSELRGFRYHTGMLFTLYDQHGMELARGGRYDAIGKAFGDARSATGFSGDLVKLALAAVPEHDTLHAQHDAAALSQRMGMPWLTQPGIGVEPPLDTAAWHAIRALRDAGERVVICLPRSSSAATHNQRYSRQLVQRDGQWVVEPL